MSEWYFDVELSEGFVASNGPDPRHVDYKKTIGPWREQAYCATNAMLRTITQHTELAPEQEANFLRQIHNGLIDPDALVHGVAAHPDGRRSWIDTLYSPRDLEREPTKRPQRLLRFMAQNSHCGTALMKALLDRAENPNCNHDHTLVRGHGLVETAFERHCDTAQLNGCPFAEVIFSHPRINLNATFHDGSHRLADHLLDVLDACNRNPRTYDTILLARTQFATAVALAHGAIPHVHWHGVYQTVNAADMSLFSTDALKSYYEKYQQMKESLLKGELSPATLNEVDMGGLYAVGGLPDILHVSLWHGHAQKALMLYESLPDFIRTQYPCELELTSLIGIMTPSSLLLPGECHLEPTTACTRMGTDRAAQR